MTVTINLINGFSFGRPVWYISMDTSIPLGAAIEHNTYAPLMQQSCWAMTTASPVPSSGSLSHERRTRLHQSTAPRPCLADLADGHRPNNVLGGIPTIALITARFGTRSLFEWTQDAVSKGFRGQVREEFQILNFVRMAFSLGRPAHHLEVRLLHQLSIVSASTRLFSLSV